MFGRTHVPTINSFSFSIFGGGTISHSLFFLIGTDYRVRSVLFPLLSVSGGPRNFYKPGQTSLKHHYLGQIDVENHVIEGVTPRASPGHGVGVAEAGEEIVSRTRSGKRGRKGRCGRSRAARRRLSLQSGRGGPESTRGGGTRRQPVPWRQ